MPSWTSRLLIVLVAAWNIQAGIVFLVSPQAFVGAYELSGAAGEAAVRGVGVLFLMWNVPYLFAAFDPIRFRLALTFALLMQLTGLVGENYILSTLTSDHAVLRESILRFIAFDGAGLVLLVVAWLLGRKLSVPTA